MRVSVPTIPHVVRPHVPQIPVAEAVDKIVNFFRGGRVTLLTGAGVSVDSGIRAYRGKDGRYMNPNYHPIFYHELVDESTKGFKFRQRYWLRGYIGYPPVRDSLPNTTHYALAALQHTSHISKIVTQNVDGLHRKPLEHIWNPRELDEHILELHGTLHRVRCKHGHLADRDTFQEMVGQANPQWKALLDEMERTGLKPRTNPDGDVQLEGVAYDDFIIPDCPTCLAQNNIRNSVHKPEVIFFGESIPEAIRERSFRNIDEADRLLIIGTTLATYSAFRLVKRALEARKPVMLINVGPTRADELPGVTKIDIPTSKVMREAAAAVIGSSANQDETLRHLLSSGILLPTHDQEPTGSVSRAEAGT